jgi:dolichol kinase
MGYPLLIAIAVLLVYGIWASKKRRTDIAMLLCFMLVGSALALYEHADTGLMLLGVLVFNALASSIGSKTNYLFFAAGAAYAFVLAGIPGLVAQAMLLGLLSRAHFFRGDGIIGSSRREKRRDIVQIAVGVALISAFVLLGYPSARLFLVSMALIGILVSNFAILNRKSGLAKMLHGLERKGATFGQGAMWLMLGALIGIAFLNSSGAIALLASIFFGDAAATIVGIEHGRYALPHNKGKSAAGSAAYFVVALAASYPFIGYAALLTALVGAIVESLPWHIDDNFDTAVVLTILLAALGYAKLI